jgi:urease accessory protein
MEGEMPSNALEGLLSGLGHPVIGVDHLAFVLAIGLLASVSQRVNYLLPGLFVIATVIGTMLHLAGVDLPLAEPVVAASVIAVGIMLLGQLAAARLTLFTLAAMAGLFHGYAYGESIVGAEPTPLATYLLGFVIIQYALSFGAYAMGRLVMINPTHLATMPRVFGTTVSLVGIGFLVNPAIIG